MLQFSLLISLVLAGWTNAWFLSDEFVADYGFKKILGNCFGPELYNYHLRELVAAQKYCRSQPVYVPEDPKYAAAENVIQYGPPSNTYEDPHLHAHAGVPPHTHTGGSVPHIHFPSVDQRRQPVTQPGYPVYPSTLLKGQGLLLRAKSANTYNSTQSALPSYLPYPPQVAQHIVPPQQGYTVYPNTILKGQNTDQVKPDYAYPQPQAHFNFQQQQQQPQTHYTSNIPLKASQAVFDSETILEMVDSVKAKISNYTCTLSRMGMVDSQFNVNIGKFRQEALQAPVGFSQTHRQDHINGLDTCYKFSTCLPVETTGMPVPASIQRVMAFFKCERKMRLRACMKEDLRKNLANFDLSGFPVQATEDEKVEKLLFLLNAMESKEFQIA